MMTSQKISETLSCEGRISSCYVVLNKTLFYQSNELIHNIVFP